MLYKYKYFRYSCIHGLDALNTMPIVKYQSNFKKFYTRIDPETSSGGRVTKIPPTILH
jgi:hypothetical protein